MIAGNARSPGAAASAAGQPPEIANAIYHGLHGLTRINARVEAGGRGAPALPLPHFLQVSGVSLQDSIILPSASSSEFLRNCSPEHFDLTSPAATDRAEESARRPKEGEHPRPGEAMRRRPACPRISRFSESTNPPIHQSEFSRLPLTSSHAGRIKPV